jgi:hypothetical protein
MQPPLAAQTFVAVLPQVYAWRWVVALDVALNAAMGAEMGVVALVRWARAYSEKAIAAKMQPPLAAQTLVAALPQVYAWRWVVAPDVALNAAMGAEMGAAAKQIEVAEILQLGAVQIAAA